MGTYGIFQQLVVTPLHAIIPWKNESGKCPLCMCGAFCLLHSAFMNLGTERFWSVGSKAAGWCLQQCLWLFVLHMYGISMRRCLNWCYGTIIPPAEEGWGRLCPSHATVPSVCTCMPVFWRVESLIGSAHRNPLGLTSGLTMSFSTTFRI